MSCSIIFTNIKLFVEAVKDLTLLGLDLGSTHSSLFQCNWNLQSFHQLLASNSLFSITSCLSCAFLLSFVLFNGGSPLALFPYTIHHQYLLTVFEFSLWSKCYFNVLRYLHEHLFHSIDICITSSARIFTKQFKPYINKIKSGT